MIDAAYSGSRRTGVTWTILAASTSVLILAQALGLFGGGSPSILAPCPLPFVMLAWGPLGPFGTLAVAGVFSSLWCIPLMRGEAALPRRTIALAVFVGLTSILWFASAMLQDLNTGGQVYTAVTMLASLSLLIATALLVRRARARPSLSVSGLTHLILFAWFFSYAYTWFGEGP